MRQIAIIIEKDIVERMNLTPFRSSPVDIKYDILGSTTAPSAEITPRGTMMILSAQSKKPSWALLESKPMRILSNTLYTLVAIRGTNKITLGFKCRISLQNFGMWKLAICFFT